MFCDKLRMRVVLVDLLDYFVDDVHGGALVVLARGFLDELCHFRFVHGEVVFAIVFD